MNKKLLFIFLAVTICIIMLPTVAFAAENVAYQDENGASKTCSEYSKVTSKDIEVNWDSGWYVVTGNQTINGGVHLAKGADIHLILTDGAKLTISGGIFDQGATLSIYGQNEGTGEMVVRRSFDASESNYIKFVVMNVSSLTMNGGKLTVDGSAANIAVESKYVYSEGINCTTLTVNDGVIDAVGSDVSITGELSSLEVSGNSSGITAYKMNVNGGKVKAVGGKVSIDHKILSNSHYSCGIHILSDDYDSSGLNITGGTVTANGNTVNVKGAVKRADYILDCQSMGIYGYVKMNVSGGTVNASGGDVTLNRTSGGDESIRTRSESIGIYVENLVLSSGELNCMYGTASLTNETNGDTGLKIERGANVDNAVVSGGEITDIFIKNTDMSDLSGGSFGKISVRNDMNMADLLSYGYAFYKDNNIYKLGSEKALSNVTVKGEHSCRFTQDDGGSLYTCTCGRSYEMEPVPYINSEGIVKYCGSYLLAKSSSTDVDWGAYNKPNWYVVRGEVTIDGEIDMDENIHLILCDDAVLTVKGGIFDEDEDLNIYAQSTGEDMGKLVTFGGKRKVGDNEYYYNYGICCEELHVNGGIVEATGADLTQSEEDGYGITFGVCCYEELNMNGGNLIAKGGSITGSNTLNQMGDSCGIYIRSNDDDDEDAYVNIKRGTIEAYGGEISGEYAHADSYGIYTYGEDDAEVLISGGKVTAKGGKISGIDVSGDSYGIYICADYEVEVVINSAEEIEAFGGNIEATERSSDSYGIYVNSWENRAKVDIKSGKITAKGGAITGDKGQHNCLGESYGFYINSDSYYDYARVAVSGGTLDAAGGNITVSGGDDGTVWASSYGLYFDDADEKVLYVRGGGTLNAVGGNVSVTRTDGKSKSSDKARSIGLSGEYTYLQGGGKINALYGTTTLNYSTEPAAGSKKGSNVAQELEMYYVDASGGTMKLKDSRIYYTVSASGGVKLADLLEEGYAYWQDAGVNGAGSPAGFVALGDKNEIYDVYIKPCTHSTASGVCDYCGKTLEGSSSSGGGHSYTVTVSDTENGTVIVSPKRAEKGDVVTITATPDKGYTLETLTVVDKNGNEIEPANGENNKFTFKMPASDVTVAGVFMDDNDMLNFFVDVPANAYYYDPVMWAVKNDITGGVDDTHFAPDISCTRAQAVTFLWRAAGSPEPKSDSKFTDVSADSYYEKAVAWAVENGITNGMSNDRFAPDMTCTRAQIVTFMFRYAAANGMDAVTLQELVSGYNDADSVPAYAVAPFNWALTLGIVQGDGNNLMPNDDCTRAQIVTMLYRLLGE